MSGSSDTTSHISWDSGEAASDREDSEFSYSPTDGHLDIREQPQALYTEPQVTSDLAAPMAAEVDSDTPWHARLNPAGPVAGPSGTTPDELQSPGSSNLQRLWCPPTAEYHETTPLLAQHQPNSTRASSLACRSTTANSGSCRLNRAPSDYLVFGDRSDPQPMGDINSELPGSARRSRGQFGSSREKLELCFRCFSICIKAVTIVSIFAILSWMIKSTNLTPWASLSTPSVSVIPLHSISDGAPPQNTPPSGYFQPEDHHPHCPINSHFSESYKFHGLTEFSLRNLIAPVRFLRLYGSVDVLSAPSSQEEDIRVDFTFETSDITLQDFLKVEVSDSSLVLDFPTSQPTPENSRECIHTHTRIYVRPALSLSNLVLESTAESVHIPSPVDLTVTNSTLVYLTAASIDAEPFFRSRKTYVEVDAGSVRGSYPIYDVLSMRAQAGSIGVEVIPQAADKEDVQPAEFVAHSKAGSIRVEYPPPDTEIPERDYRADVQSEVGSISGRFLHGTNSAFKADVGSMKIDLLPYAADRYESTLTVENQMGSQRIVLLTPYLDGQTAIRRLKSRHLSDAGGIQITYPQAWEGNIKATSKVGRVAVGGPGVEIVRQGRQGVGMFIDAKKGNGQGQGNAEIDAGRGSVNFEVSKD